MKREANGHYLPKHGHHDSPTYKVWENMIRRCTNPNFKWFYLYGGRGISVCDSWRDFRNFLADMGERPAGLMLDRLDNERGYEPGNCRWATQTQQQRNKRNNRRFTLDGETLTLIEWAERVGVSERTIRWRVSVGWPLQEALTAPRRGHFRRAAAVLALARHDDAPQETEPEPE